MRLEILFRKRWWLLYTPIFLISAFLLWQSWVRWLPVPPDSLVMAAGVPGGGYTELARQYQQKLAALGIRCDIVTTEKAHGGFKLISTEPNVDVALVNGMFAKQADETKFHALAVVQQDPIWIFTRIPTLTHLHQLRGLRVGLPDYDELNMTVLARVLGQGRLTIQDIQSVPLSRANMANALIDGNVDAVVFMGSIRNDIVTTLSRSAGMQLMGMDRIGAVTHADSNLTPMAMPQGAIEFRGDVPSRDLTLAVANVHLLIRSDMHPALQRAIIDVSHQIHESPHFMHRSSEFPRVIGSDFKISPTSLAYARDSKPWVEYVLPYGWAQWTQWLLYAALPILIITGFLLAWIPGWFEWRANAVLQNFYGELKFLETEIEPVASERPIEIKRLLERLDEIDMQVMQLDLPTPYAERWYTLRTHLAGARERLLALRAR
jgi:TRAP-type uncharacterized transport system substrate-binding protein